MCSIFCWVLRSPYCPLMNFPISAAAAAVCCQGMKGLQPCLLPPGHILVGNRSDYWLIGRMGSNVSTWSATTEKESDSSKLQSVIEVKWFWVPEDGREKKREKRDLLNSDKWNKILQILPNFFLACSFCISSPWPPPLLSALNWADRFPALIPR